MKLSVFTVMLPDMTPSEAAKAIKDTGYDGVEWRVKQKPKDSQQTPSFWGNNLCTFEPNPKAALEAKNLSEAHHLETPTIGSYSELGELESVRASLEFAKTLGSPQFRVGLSNYEGDYHKHFRKAKAFLEEVIDLASDYKLKVLLEIHHRTIVPSCSLMHSLVKHFDPNDLGVIHDAGNMAHEGFENYQMGLEILGDYLAHVHVKNAKYLPAEDGISRAVMSDISDGVVDFEALFQALKTIGYDGWLGVEDFGAARPSLESLQYNFDFINATWENA